MASAEDKGLPLLFLLVPGVREERETAIDHYLLRRSGHTYFILCSSRGTAAIMLCSHALRMRARWLVGWWSLFVFDTFDEVQTTGC